MNRTIFILDSGAFSVWAQAQGGSAHKVALRNEARRLYAEFGTKACVAELMGLKIGTVSNLLDSKLIDLVTLEKYAEFVSDYGLHFRGGAFNLDVMGDAEASYRNWIELRRMGVETIPIHHVGDDDVFLKKYLDVSEYIGIGAIAKLETTNRLIGLDRAFKMHLINPDGTPRVRLHGLGLTDNSIVLRYPWYSIDSTSAVVSAAYGQVFVPKLDRHGQPDFSDVRMMSVSDQDRDHVVGKTNSFYSLPHIVRRNISNFIRSQGLEISDSIQGRKLNSISSELRSKNIPVWSNGLGINIEVDEAETSDEVRNVTRHWMARYELNLRVIDAFIQYHAAIGHDVKLYHVCGTKIVLEKYLDHSARSNIGRCLVSFAKLIGTRGVVQNMLDLIKKAVRGRYGDRSSETAGVGGSHLTGNGTEGSVRAGH